MKRVLVADDEENIRLVLATVLKKAGYEVEAVASLANNLASAIANQSAGLSEVSLGLNQLDQVTQQNAGMVDQTAATQRMIRDEAEKLGILVSRFQLGAESAAPKDDSLRWAS